MAGLTFCYNNKNPMKEQPSKTTIGLAVVELTLREAENTTYQDPYLLKLANQALGQKVYIAPSTPLSREYDVQAEQYDSLTRRNKCAYT